MDVRLFEELWASREAARKHDIAELSNMDRQRRKLEEKDQINITRNSRV